jgi:hypothetical protein
VVAVAGAAVARAALSQATTTMMAFVSMAHPSELVLHLAG